MSIYRPSFMAMVTLKIDERAVLVGPDLQAALNLPGIVVNKHAQWLRALFPGNVAVSHRLQPLRCTINRNSHMTADTCTLAVSWRHLGFDPTVISGAIVQIFAGTISHSEYARGIVELTDDRMVDPRSVIVSSSDKAIFTGKADSISVDWGGSKRISFECRDFTQVLLDNKVPTFVLNDPPDFGLSLDKWVLNLIDTLPTISGLISEVKLIGVDRKDVPPAMNSTAIPSIMRSVKKKKGRSRPKLFGQFSYWELIVDVCVGAGFIPNVEGTAITLRQARTYLGKESWNDTRFQRVIDGQLTHVRRLTYGQNLKNFTLERKLSNSSVPAIKVVSSIDGNVFSATWPPEEALKNAQVNPFAPGGEEQEQKVLVIPVDSTDPAVIKELARNLWEMISRQEFKGSLTTTELASDGGDNDDPDMLAIGPGHPFEVAIGKDSLLRGTGVGDEVLGIHDMEEATIARVLANRSTEEVTAESTSKFAIAARAIKSGTKQRVFRVGEVALDFDSTRGVSISIDFHNWYEVLWDALREDAEGKFAVRRKPVQPASAGAE